MIQEKIGLKDLSLQNSVYELEFVDLYTDSHQVDNQRQESLFHFWKSSWENSFADLEYKEKLQLYSDDFFNRRVLSFFHQSTPVGCIFLESFDLNSSAHRASRYITNYPPDMISHLIQQGVHKAYALSNLTINPEWRKSKTDLHLSQILTTLGMWIACNEKGHVMLSCVRNDRKVNSVFQRHGSKTFCTETRYNCEVDFIYIDLKDVRIFPDKDMLKAAFYFTTGNKMDFFENPNLTVI